MSETGIPIVTDVTFRVSEDGAMIGMDLECRGGEIRSVAIPVADLSKLFAGFAWAGDESASRRSPAPIDAATRERLRDGARQVTDWRVVTAAGERFLEVTIGAAFLCVRLPRDA